MFEIGDKIVCVDDSPSNRDGTTLPIHRGFVYVVRDAGPEPFTEGGWVRLVGVYLRYDPFFKRESAFASHRFRKLSDMQAEARNRQKQDQPVEV